MPRTCSLVIVALAATALSALAAENLVRCGGFEGAAEAAAAGWKLGESVTIEQGPSAEGAHYLQCPCTQPGSPTSAQLPGVPVKPRTGYVARCRVRVAGDSGAHYTFGYLNSDTGKFFGGSFKACADEGGGNLLAM